MTPSRPTGCFPPAAGSKARCWRTGTPWALIRGPRYPPITAFWSGCTIPTPAGDCRSLTATASPLVIRWPSPGRAATPDGSSPGLDAEAGQTPRVSDSSADSLPVCLAPTAAWASEVDTSAGGQFRRVRYMRRAMKSVDALGTCVICGVSPATSREHIPPQCLYIQRPRDYLTVPACERCNHETKLDDEYFQLMMAQMCGQVEAQDLWRSKVQPKLDRRPATEELVSRSRGLGAVDGGSGDVRYFPIVSPDWMRLTRVVKKITCGLHWHHTGRIIPAECRVVITPAPARALNTILDDEWWGHVGRFLHAGRYHHTPASRTYTYLYSAEHYASIWLHLFFVQHGFIATVAPPQAMTIPGRQT